MNHSKEIAEMIPKVAQIIKSSIHFRSIFSALNGDILKIYRQPNKIPPTYASEYHRITTGPISNAIGSMAGNAIANIFLNLFSLQNFKYRGRRLRENY